MMLGALASRRRGHVGAIIGIFELYIYRRRASRQDGATSWFQAALQAIFKNRRQEVAAN